MPYVPETLLTAAQAAAIVAWIEWRVRAELARQREDLERVLPATRRKPPRGSGGHRRLSDR